MTTGHRQRAAATTRNRDALARWRPGDALSALAMPRLVIDGERDRLAGGATAERAAQALGCVRVCLPGIGHSPPLEAPERVAALIGELVDTGGVSAE